MSKSVGERFQSVIKVEKAVESVDTCVREVAGLGSREVLFGDKFGKAGEFRKVACEKQFGVTPVEIGGRA